MDEEKLNDQFDWRKNRTSLIEQPKKKMKKSDIYYIICLGTCFSVFWILVMSITNSALHFHSVPKCFFSEIDKYEKSQHDDGSFCMPVGRDLKHFYCCKSNIYNYEGPDGNMHQYTEPVPFSIVNFAISGFFVVVMSVVLFVLIDNMIKYHRNERDTNV